MSSSAWETFRARLADDGTFREELARSVGNGGKEKVSLAALVAFAGARGYEFSEKDVLSSIELTDEQLDAVAGGSGDVQFDCSELVEWASGQSAQPKTLGLPWATFKR